MRYRGGKQHQLVLCERPVMYKNLVQPWPQCPANDNRLLSLFNLLCNATQTMSITTRDACYGCFFRAGALAAGPAQLSAISQCATLYLLNSSYALCATNLAAIVTGFRPATITPDGSFNSNCYTGHCEFVQCIRRVNGNKLINECILQTLVNRDLNVEAQRVGFYVNTTSCILARVRCDTYNPITGKLQQVAAGVRGRTTTNSLQVSSTGDIRVISFPARVSVSDAFCSARTLLDQSSFANSVC
ncbi:uncharacterized protein LOC125952612 isoform X2 [Anopheles darlingi]|uniref:uncharacterized protein LOC125952612 isoform X2 n=1 Tax=Anopheles darlingi TaxID=43151 RepID=UPI0021002EF6|nr:uncharacterized protein LOC125952612 isoform X2 [Anopheles darlingi]XP_049538156.1 uncharacterized protein LOC125952612 isoform X2 [Anopheles darlingi]XP_049538157.1 uncharacterized protein LOC125952612 isoform X2 [Anopheles darlingi]XP_049538158.1 uncharacterized protein LOC125952612 isoform X2 [Anopheles darlingi]